MTTPSSRYVLITPVKDESRHIELTLRSVTAQTCPPALWVIVDDGSSDGTAEIAERYAARHSYIRVQRTPNAGARNLGSAEILAFYRGLETVRGVDYDFIVKLDGDLEFEPDYFERLLAKFAADPKLGIASGVYLEQDADGSWRVVGMPAYHAFGASKVMRRRCFEDIGGFALTPGWDTADEVRAWSFGWTTSHFRELEVRHHKPEGSASGLLKISRMHGLIHYVTGGDPLFFIFKAVHRARLKPYVLGSLALTYGYIQAVVTRRPRLVTDEQAAAYRRIMRERLWRFARKPMSSAAEYRT
jgi:glycosyltransferase involved in cell wall biosynthesis